MYQRRRYAQSIPIHLIPLYPYYTSQLPSYIQPTSFINLIKRPSIRKAAIPHFIHHLSGMHIILNPRPRHQAQRRPPPHTVLQLLCDPPLVSGEELAGEATLA